MPWVSIIVLLPLLGALSMLAVPDAPGGLRQARIQAIATVAGTAVFTGILIGLFDQSVPGLQYIDHVSWADEVGLAWDVGVDGISIWLLALTVGTFLLAVLAACWRPPERPRAFLALLLLAETGLLGLFAAGNLVLFYVFWEAMLIPFYFLVGMWGGAGRGRANITFVIYTMIGSLLMLVAILATAFTARDITGQFTFQIRDLAGVAFTDTQSTWLFLGFALAFVIKLPLWPFHGWLPGVYRAAPILVTGLLAAVMSKAGVYGLLRIGLPVFPVGADRFAIPIGVLAVVGIVYGSLVAWRQPTMRGLVAYSSLAHLGFIALGIVAFDVQASQGAVLQMVNHGIVVPRDVRDRRGAQPLRARRPHRRDRRPCRRRAAHGGRLPDRRDGVPRHPGLNTFVGEFFILTGVFRQHLWLAVLACIGIAYAAVYMLRIYQGTMNGPRRGDARGVELRAGDLMVLVPLIAVMLFIALWPKALVDATTPAIEQNIAPAQVAADRPADQIKGAVAPNPPAYATPLPGDAAEGDAAAAAAGAAAP